MRVDSSFYIIACLDVIAVINVTPNVALQGGGSRLGPNGSQNELCTCLKIIIVNLF